MRLISVIPKKEFISAKYLYLFLDRLNIIGTGTTQQQLTIPDFKKYSRKQKLMNTKDRWLRREESACD